MELLEDLLTALHTRRGRKAVMGARLWPWAKVLMARSGLGGSEPPTLDAAGQLIGVTRERLIEAAQARWRAMNAPHLVPLVRAGATFHKGKLVERQADHDTDVKVA